MRHFWKKYHKWVGLFFTFFILMFCISGIILNHRHFFSAREVSRSWMPSDYRYENWNNGIVKGTVKLSNNNVLTYGNAGIWETDSCFSAFSSLNEGLKEGVDNRKISNVVEMPDGGIWCAGLYDFYRLSDDHNRWDVRTPAGETERIADIYGRGDTLVVLSRSYIFESLPPYKDFKRYELRTPADYSPKVSMFRTIWMLHSGELFGLPGQLFVDFLALILVVLCLTGLIYLFIPKSMRYRARRKLPVKKEGRLLKFAVKWHNKLGAWTIFFTVVLAATGMCLRPPLMIPFAMTSVKPLPGSTLDSDNVWHDKLRSIRWDEQLQCWLMSTSNGFYAMKDFNAIPVSLKRAAPVSPMGINVFTKNAKGEWLIGSFSGLFRWNIATGEVYDYFTGQPHKATFGRPIASIAVSGISNDWAFGKELIFDYSRGSRTKTDEQIHIADMPEDMVHQPMSLWNFALELHVGRCYSPFLGPLSSMFVFLSGLLLTLILLSGYIIHRKPKTKKRNKVAAVDDNK